MTRVEDNQEARTAERLAQQKLEAKVAEESRKFAQIVNNRQNQKTQGARQDANQHNRKSGGERTSAQEALLVRQGTTANFQVAQLLGEGSKRLDKNREERGVRSEEQATKRDKESALEEGRQSRSGGDKLAPVSRDDRGQGSSGNEAQSGDKRERAQENLAALNASGMNPAFKLSNTATTKGASAGPLSQQELINQIVDKVYKGRDADGRKLMGVQLKDMVMGGATLMFTHDDDGVSVDIHTLDNGAAKLLSNEEHVGALSERLQEKEIRLKTLVVNGQKVL